MIGKGARNDFPIYSHNSVDGGFCYLDSAATSLKPKRVVDAVRGYYEEYSTNVHRGVYPLAEKATAEYERARQDIAQFIGATRKEEIVFVRNATEALNLLAMSYARFFLREGDGILLTEMEHHANLVPWQQIAKEKKLRLYFLPFDTDTGELIWDAENFFVFLRERNIKILSLAHVSNVLGTINPVKEIITEAKKAGVVAIVDGCQSVPHLPVDVQDLGADFFVFSGHKMLGPTGIGVLWGRYELLEKMPPFMTGGEMIRDVNLEYSTFQDPPLKFEAGTPHIAGAIGLGEAVRFLKDIGMADIRAHEKELLTYALARLGEISGFRLLGTKNIELRSGVISFVIEGIHPHDVGSFLGDAGVMIRVGDHCAKPLHKKLKLPASSRMSFYVYNDKDDIDKAIEALQKLVKTFLG